MRPSEQAAGTRPRDALVVELGHQLSLLADELRGLATEGLRFDPDEYQSSRYERVLRISAELAALQDTRDAGELAKTFRSDLSHVSPWVGTNSAVFRDDGRLLLIQRADDRLWALPGGLLEIGESPSEGARREVEEETGLSVRPAKLVALQDWARAGWAGAPGHLHCYLFICERVDSDAEPTLSNETRDVGWFDFDSLPELSPGHAVAVSLCFAGRSQGTEAVFD